MRADAHRVLSTWEPPDAQQASLRDDYLRFLAAHEDAMWRSCRSGHLTASALVVDEDHERVLLTLHPKVGRWLQLGGHCEADDEGLRAAARREVREESGIRSVRMSRAPLRLDRHRVACGGAPSEHLDVQFLAVVPTGAPVVRSEESDDLAWFAVDALPDGLDASVRALIDAAHAVRPPVD